MPSNPHLAGSEYDDDTATPTDAELGIGEEVAAAPEAVAAADQTAQLAAVLASPAFQVLLDAAVEARVKAMGLAAPGPAPGGLDLTALVEKLATAIDRNATSTASQQPGYVKPLPPQEIEARAAAFVEMRALLDRARQGGDRPTYLLMEIFYAGDTQWYPGDTIYWNDIPNTEMQPQNEIARTIHAQFERWIGGKHQASLLDQAIEARNQRLGIAGAPSLPPEIGPSQLVPTRINERGVIELVPGTMRRDIAPSRTLGTLVPEHSAQDPQNIMGGVPNLPHAAQGA